MKIGTDTDFLVSPRRPTGCPLAHSRRHGWGNGASPFDELRAPSLPRGEGAARPTDERSASRPCRSRRESAREQPADRLARILGEIRSVPILVFTVVLLAGGAVAEEILKFDGTRIMCTIDAVKDGALQVHRATGEPASVPLGEIVVIYFKGREPRSIRSGMQEFHFINGDKIRAEIKDVEGDDLVVHSHALGQYRFGMDNLDGFLTIPIEGMSGRRAEELVFDEPLDETGLLDQVLDRRCVYYEGVIEEISPQGMTLDHERLMKPVNLNIIYLAGVRLAEKAKKKAPGLPAELFCRMYTRDGSAMDGFVQKIEFGKWHMKSMWDPKKTMEILTDEIVLMEVLNGRTLYLSQLDPVEVKETTVLAPKQHYRKNRNCRGDVMTVGDNSYTWGIGVHATSELTFKIGKIFKTFEASVGVDGQVGDGGSVVFKVIGDGSELYKSRLVRGSDKDALRISVPVEGVEKLTLKVEDGGDLDLGDYANWAMAKLVR